MLSAATGPCYQARHLRRAITPAPMRPRRAGAPAEPPATEPVHASLGAGVCFAGVAGAEGTDVAGVGVAGVGVAGVGVAGAEGTGVEVTEGVGGGGRRGGRRRCGARLGCRIIRHLGDHDVGVRTHSARVGGVIGVDCSSGSVEASGRLAWDDFVPLGQRRERRHGGSRRVILIVGVGLCRVHGAVGINETNLTEG